MLGGFKLPAESQAWLHEAEVAEALRRLRQIAEVSPVRNRKLWGRGLSETCPLHFCENAELGGLVDVTCDIEFLYELMVDF